MSVQFLYRLPFPNLLPYVIAYVGTYCVWHIDNKRLPIVPDYGIQFIIGSWQMEEADKDWMMINQDGG